MVLPDLPQQQEFSDSATPTFQPLQIVCLEYQTTRLFAEVVQIIEQRQICWARPLCLVVLAAEPPSVSNWQLWSQFYDLRSASDLLLPIGLFRAALDEEVMPLVGQLYQAEAADKSAAIGQRQMHQLVRDVCQAAAHLFN